MRCALLILLAGCAATPAGDPILETLWLDGDFTEGPAAAPDGAILFSDIGDRILRFDPRDGKTSVYRHPSGKANGLAFDRQGRLLACEGAHGGGRRLSITGPDGAVRTLADRWQGKRFNSPNDLSIDPAGNVYFTDPRYVGDEPRELDFEGVFRVSPEGEVVLATRDVEKPNGIVVAPDGRTAWVADNNPKGKRQLVAFSVRPDGTFADKRVLHDFGQGRGIDGMKLGPEGLLWATAGSGPKGGLYVFSPDGKLVRFIPTPGDPTNCAFAGRDLYVTSAGPGKRYGLFRLRP